MCSHVALYYKIKWIEKENKDFATQTICDLGGTLPDMNLIPRRIILKDEDFDRFIKNLDTDESWKAHWEDFFQKHCTDDFIDFMEDREQDMPKDIDL